MLFCFLRFYWVFIKSVFVVGSEVIAVCDILYSKNILFCCNCLLCLFWVWFWLWDFGLFVVIVCAIDFMFDWWDSLSCLFWWFVLSVLLIEWLWGLFFLIVWLIVPVGCFSLNGCDFVRKKKNIGLTVHCNVAFVKPCVKTSVLWFKRLIFWFGRVLFVVKTLLCSERRFASGTN